MALPPPQPIPASPTANQHAIPLAPSTPAPHRARLTSLEGQIAQLIAQRQSAERRHRAEVAELKGLLAEARGRAEEGEGEVGRCRREGEHMRTELLEDHQLFAQRARLALLAEQLAAESLREEVRTLQIHSVMRNHKLVRFKHREARSDRQFDALEERERLASTKLLKLQSINQSTTAQRDAAAAEREAAAGSALAQAQKQLARLESALANKEAEVTRQVEETQRVEGLFKARERAWREEDRERERRGREGVEEVEQEVERQVEETKRVESALRLREKEVRDLKKQLHAAKLAATAVRSAPDRFDDDDADAGMSSAAEEVVAPPLIAKPKKSAKPAAPPPPPVEKPKKSAAPVKGAPTGVKRPVEAQSSDDDESATEMVVKERKKKSTAPAKSSAPAKIAPPVKRAANAEASENEGDATEAVVKEKKKKRKLGGGLLKTGKRFDWDVVEGSGIPTMLSPVKPSAKSAFGGPGGLKGKSLAGRW